MAKFGLVTVELPEYGEIACPDIKQLHEDSLRDARGELITIMDNNDRYPRAYYYGCAIVLSRINAELQIRSEKSQTNAC